MWLPTSEDLRQAADSTCYLEYTEADLDFSSVPTTPMRVNPSDRDGPLITTRQFVEDRFNFGWRNGGKVMIAAQRSDQAMYPTGYTEYCCVEGATRKRDFYS